MMKQYVDGHKIHFQFELNVVFTQELRDYTKTHLANQNHPLLETTGYSAVSS
jgi:hypothetical protein